MVLMSSFISNSKKLPKAFSIAFVLIALTIIIGAYYLIKTEAFPAPMFTGRVSLDEKFRFMRLHDFSQSDFIVLGSSTALNNISSEVIFSRPEIGKNYFNFAAWGMTISETLEYWRFLETMIRPKVVVLYINLFDFEEGRKVVFDHNDIKRYIRGASPLPYYFKYHKKGLAERIKSVGHRRRTNDDFDTLKFDEGGGALFEIPENEISQNDWTNYLSEKCFVNTHYIALGNLLEIIDSNLNHW